jgi:Icc-related predicted phosphoesterase
MPKLAILSDTHFERRTPPAIDCSALPEFDVLIHAGDLAERNLDRALDWLAGLAGGKPVIWCPGNHDLYGVGTKWRDAPLVDRVAEVAFAARAHGIATLAPLHDAVSRFDGGVASISPCGCFDLPGVVIVGSTLWTDWRLAGLWRMIEPYGAVDLEMAAFEILPCIRPMHSPDFLHLKDRFGQEWRPWSIAAEHAIHVDAIDRTIEGLAPHGKGARNQAVVVVSHHAPHPKSVEPYREMPLPDWAPGFYGSDLRWLIERHRPAAWIHGHVHVPVDYLVGDTRIVSNPCPNSFSLKIVEV